MGSRQSGGEERTTSRIPDCLRAINQCLRAGQTGQANLYGSEPPENDSLWRAIRARGWEVKTMERNYAGKEKGIDIQIALDMNEFSRDVKPPGTMIRLAGDGDYQTLIPRLQDRGWEIEIGFYQNVAQSIRTLANRFISLEDRLHEIRFK